MDSVGGKVERISVNSMKKGFFGPNRQGQGHPEQGKHRDADQVPGPALPPAGQKLGPHGEPVGHCGCRGAGMGH